MLTPRVISKSALISGLCLLFAVGCAQEENSESAATSSPGPSAATEVAPLPEEATVPLDDANRLPEEMEEVPTELVSLKKEKVEPGYGDISGQILFEGDIPKLALAVKQGDAKIKDAAVCAAKDLESNTLLVDPETKGIANVFVYIYPKNIKKHGIKIHPEAAKIKETEIVFDQKNCRFIPHVMVVRVGQNVRVKSADNCAHNTHTTAIRNDEFNTIIAPNDREGVLIDDNYIKSAESLPLPVKCDIHPWMKAHWLVIDHPYVAVTDKQGRFTIEKLPVGEIEFRIWHELPGYINTKYKVAVEEGKTELEPVKVSAAKFDE